MRGLSEIIYIAGAPRSGTSWLGQLFNSSDKTAYRFQPLFSYAFKAALNKSSSQQEIELFFEELKETSDEFVLQKKNISGKEAPSFIKRDKCSHLVIKEVRYHYVLNNLLSKTNNVKLIGLVRHPCGVINSWTKAPKEFDKGWEIQREWLDAGLKNNNLPENYYGYNKWKELYFLFVELQKLFPSRVKIVKYEQLVNDTEPVIKDLFEFSGIDFNNQTKQFIIDSKNTESLDSYGVFRKDQDVNSWKNELLPDIQNLILEDLQREKINLW